MSETTEAMPAIVETPVTSGEPVRPISATPAQIQQPPLLHGAVDFEIEPGASGEPWHATNGKIGVTVFASEANAEPSKRLGETPALLYKHNSIHMPMGKAAAVPFTHRTQVLIAELNGVFVHLVERDGSTAIVIADKRLGS